MRRFQHRRRDVKAVLENRFEAQDRTAQLLGLGFSLKFIDLRIALVMAMPRSDYLRHNS